MFGHERVTREILGNVPALVSLGFYLLAGAASVLAFLGFYRRFRQHRQAPTRTGSLNRRGFPDVLKYLVFQHEIRRDPFAGVAHLLVFYGFLILFWGTCLVFLEHDTPLHFFYGWFYQVASLIVDLGGLAFVVGLGMFLWRRYGKRSADVLREWWVASLTWLLLAIGISGFLLEALRIAQKLPDFERWSVVGYGLAAAIRVGGFSEESLVSMQRAIWIGHAGLCVAFFALLPWQFFSHLVYGTASWSKRRGGALSQLYYAEASGTVLDGDGATTSSSISPIFSYEDRVEADACTTCGRCVAACPAHAAGKPLQPRNIVLQIRAAMDSASGQVLGGPDLNDSLWSCTTCGACNAVCPVGIDVYRKIVDLRRERVEQGDVPESAERLYENVADRQNPFARSNAERMAWAGGLDVPIAEQSEPIELLYWVGCAGSFDPDGQSVARATVQLLKRMGVNFRVLGCRERCTGDPARRLGEEGLFRQQSQTVIELLRQHQVRKIVTHCPHCLNTLRHEYPTIAAGLCGNEPTEGRTSWGPTSWVVQHHSEFLAEALASGKLKSSVRPAETITYHDPCYLARGQGVTQEPRDILATVHPSTMVEMVNRREETFCCGAGGGAMWVDIAGKDRIENIRAREATQTGATTIVTGCPFCKSMLRAGVQSLSNREDNVGGAEPFVERNGTATSLRRSDALGPRRPVRVLDISELLIGPEEV